MARINPRDFVGTRARFQRLRDAKIFNGWIENFFGSKLDVVTTTETPVLVGDEFRFEGFGHHISVVFQAKLEGVGTFDMASGGILTAIEGSNAKMIDASRVTLNLAVTSPIRYAASSESVRMMVNDIFSRILVHGSEIEGFTVDVAPNGAGLVTSGKVEPGETVIVIIDTNLGPVKAQAIVRYCRPDKERSGYYRVGLMFVDMGRIERPRWERFLRELN
ncbi:MAG: PilZ domain-containing protein [Fimbriimonadaceae bacterium]|jgi:hypothetical protein|nr:PilZ domain-containing protein [Fimbriimonadaceae bacterium]